MKPIRCPQCKSIEVYLEEYIDCISCWYPGESSGYHHAGGYYKVVGNCEECGHYWRLRNKLQMDEELKSRLRVNAEMMKGT